MKGQPIIDPLTYYVTGPNGFRSRWLRKEEALALGLRMVEQSKQAGWSGTFRVYFRDGTVVETYRVGAG